MLVADGMGGARELASAWSFGSQEICLAGGQVVLRTGRSQRRRAMRLLRQGLDHIDKKLVSQAEGDAALTGMGSTLTAACSFGSELLLVHVGDSRAYLFRQDELEQLTTDHTLAQRLVDTGLLGPESLRTSRVRHVLINALGAHPGVVPETEKLRLADGDRLMICSDGLTEMLSDKQIAEVLRLNPKPSAACQALVDAALDKGGRDNVPVVLAAYSIEKEDRDRWAP